VYDTQILNPHYSPDGNSIVFSMADKEANLDLFILELASGVVRRITEDPAADYDPVWHPGGDFVSYTSHASSTPNIHTVNVTTGASKQVSDVGDAIWVAQWSPVDSSIMATTLPDVDTVRIANIDPHRSVTTQPLAIRSHYSGWRSAGPAIPLISIDPQRDIDIVDSHSYKPFSVFRHQGSLIFPAGTTGIFGLTQWSDAMTRHLYTGIGIVDFSEDGTNYLFLQYANAMGGPLWGINLKVNKGEIHALMGPNGSGKSTLANVITGHEDYEITKGNIYFKSNEINELSASERAHEGIFMSFQYPVEIPGLTVTNFIKTAINESRKAKGLDEMSSREMLKKIREKSSLLDIDSKLLSRSLNEGFSGGEKKRNEIFQMAMLEPELAVLDETDSGLDIDMLKIVANGVIKYSNDNNAVLVITHYQRLLDYIVPDFVHVILDGKVIKSGDQSLAKRIEDKGYDWLKKEKK